MSPGDTAPAPSAGETVLVVEDNDAAREALAALLRQHDYAVALAEDGKQALDQLDTHPPPRLILLDMLMPVLDGWRFLQLLRQRAARIPVIIVTGGILTREWAADHGCDGFLKKPIDPDALLAEIRRCFP